MNQKENDVLANRYRLVKILGEGSYGIVWLADDLQLQIKVAIKILHPGMGRIADLQKEAVTQARLNHPHIAIIYSVDVDDRFIAMEYIEGESLGDYLRNCVIGRSWISKDKATDFLSQCFQALMHAHENSVVHGDIKPANIMIHQNKTIKITDFGVAKVISEEQMRGYLPNIGRRIGSITYMAPEVLKGEPRTYRSDLFSLGVISYLLFTGHHPFYNPHPSGLFGVREMLLSDEEPKRPREVNPDISEEYENVITKMITKNPENRYSSMKHAYEELVDIGLLCRRCSYKNLANANFCSKCGQSLREVRENQYKDKSPRELWQRAFELNAVGQFEEAIKFCDEAIKLQSDFADPYQTKGFALSSLGKYSDARKSYEMALKYAQDQMQMANIHTNMSFTYMMEHNYEKLVEELEKALEYDPNHYKAKQLLEKFKGGR